MPASKPESARKCNRRFNPKPRVLSHEPIRHRHVSNTTNYFAPLQEAIISSVLCQAYSLLAQPKASLSSGDEFLGHVRRLRQEQTREEKQLWSALRAGRFAGFRFRRQHPVGRYALDFYCRLARLSVELERLFTRSAAATGRTTSGGRSSSRSVALRSCDFGTGNGVKSVKECWLRFGMRFSPEPAAARSCANWKLRRISRCLRISLERSRLGSRRGRTNIHVGGACKATSPQPSPPGGGEGDV